MIARWVDLVSVLLSYIVHIYACTPTCKSAYNSARDAMCTHANVGIKEGSMVCRLQSYSLLSTCVLLYNVGGTC
jgi:hypothetical protein